MIYQTGLILCGRLRLLLGRYGIVLSHSLVVNRFYLIDFVFRNNASAIQFLVAF